MRLRRGTASITERPLTWKKLLRMFSCAPPSLCTIAAFAWTRIMLASRRTSQDLYPLSVCRADGDQCVVRRAASNVACNIMQASSVMGSPVMEMLRVEGSRRCDDRSALLCYSSYDSDNDSKAASSKRFNVKARQVSATIVYMMVLKFT